MNKLINRRNFNAGLGASLGALGVTSAGIAPAAASGASSPPANLSGRTAMPRSGAARGKPEAATYVLVSGAWHASWCWERVTPLLEAAGHRVIAPDLLGMGKDKTPVAEVTLAAWADQIADIVRRAGDKVVLVGHSRGGIVISETAERVPDRIRTLAYLTAFLVPAGGSLVSSLGLMPQPWTRNVIPGNGTTSVAEPAIGPTFYNRTDPAWVARAKAQIGPEPMAPSGTPLQVTDARFGSVPRAYIECLQDRTIPIELQRLMQQKLPCDPVFTLDSDHSPFFSAPDALAKCLLQLV